jgi:phosphatidylserine/phosphatidylglycerophosphate/cardiolipin synthase-like enzyme
VLLDKDAEGDLYQTRSINGPAARYLLDHKVTVRQRSAANVNHLKCLLSDGRLVLSGSHNWTAGALRRYDELSMFIDSTMLAARFAAKFDALWEKAAPA